MLMALKFCTASWYSLLVPQTSIQASILGTASYMAPELMAGGSMSKAADIYSLGILSE